MIRGAAGAAPRAMGDDPGVGDQVMRRGVSDPGGHDVTGLRAPLDVDEAPVARPPGDPARVTVLATVPRGDQNLDLPTDELARRSPGDLLLQLDEPVVALLHDGLRNLVGHVSRGRPGALGVLEGE